LVSNAIKFTRQGEIFINVALAGGGEQAKTADQIRLEFSVTDTGIGLTAEQIGGLFQSFSQADKSTTREYGGTGLGLAICKRMVSMMQGDIHVTSELGQGSTFMFTAVLGQLQGVAQKRAASRDAYRGIKALVVDADAASRDAICLYLETFYFQVTRAGTGERAIQLLENAPVEEPYQLVLMDWNLPKMDGITTARQINNSRNMTRVPHIIMMTAHSRDDIALRVTDFNLDGFLVKPVHPSALFNAVVDAFGHDDSPVLQARDLGVVNEELHQIQGAKLLLVEDNQINQQVAKETLEQEGFDVTIATDGQDAVHKIRAVHFDAVLMDLQMPIMDGYQATRIIRSEATFDDLPIIAMTAHAQSDVREKCLQIGMNGYVTKPLDVDELLANLVGFIKPMHATMDACREQATPQKGGLLPEFLPGIDLPRALKNVAGNARLFCDLLIKFQESYGDVQSRLDAFLQAGDVDSALQLLHTMKGVAANLAMLELKACLEELERVLKTKSNHTPELLADFALAQNRVLDSVRLLNLSGGQNMTAKMDGVSLTD
jgi:CheY-like chemotaxis protein/HPt (histidine-containing phosphotransfer) domain-containing protein